MSFKVIKIIDEDRIVINGGSDDLIKKGDKLEIYIEGEDLIDDEGINYGKLNFVKAEIEALQVEERISICANTEHEVSGIMQIGIGMQRKYRKSLNVATEEISGAGDIDDDYTIRTGDKVRKMISS